MRLEEDKLRK